MSTLLDRVGNTKKDEEKANKPKESQAKGDHIHLLVTPAFKREFKAFTAARGLKMSDVAQRVLAEYMERNK